MCGILGLLLADTRDHVRSSLFDGLTVLQHRGQDAAGIVTSCTTHGSTRLNQSKGLGMVRDVFGNEEMLHLEGNAGVAHCRYPTAGRTRTAEEAQPLYLNFPCGLALAHNGNLTNTAFLQRHVRGLHRHLNTQSDSEALLNVFAEMLRVELDKRTGERSDRIEPEMIFSAVEGTMKLCRGGYAIVMLIHDVGVVAFRDPWGIRPLVMGKRQSKTLGEAGGIDYLFASESVAVDTLGFQLLRDVKPGECVVAVPMVPGSPRDDLGLITRQVIGDGATINACLFEYVYFSRPDTVMNGVSVHEARVRMGEKLAANIRRRCPDVVFDVCIPIPDTSRTSALACANAMGVAYSEGFIKNRYIGRTFIMPEQTMRRKSVRLKLNTVKSEFKGRTVLLVDDSIVRGTTSTELVQMARDAGAAKVYFASAAPQIRHPNVYGIDLPAASELVAHDRTDEEICKAIGADMVLFQDLADLEDAVRSLNPALEVFETSTFTGTYVTNDVDDDYFASLASQRSEFAKLRRESSRSVGSTLSTP